MNWDDTPEQAAFREEVRAFVRDRFPPSYGPDTEAEQSLEPEDVLGYTWPADRSGPDPVRREGARAWAAALAERGWIAPHWPVEYGGAGLSPMEEFILLEELMRARVPTVNGIGAFLLGPTLLVHGTREQKAEHLPPIARGERTWAQGFSEPGAGSDLAALRTRAVRDGDGYVIDGQKVWTSLGQYADWLFVLVRTDPDAEPRHRGITFLLVDAATPGVTVQPIVDLRGDTPFCEVFFEGVRVPESCRVGEENRGWYVAMTALGFERAGIGATIKYEQALNDLVAYVRSPEGRARTRTDRGASFRREIARRHTEIRVLANLARYTVSRQAAGAEPGFEASVNQLFGAELHQRLARTGAKAFGRSGALWERAGAPLNGTFTHMRRDAVAATFLGGAAEIQRNVIATRGLRLPRS
ncbi:acyl-CoA dehydrogenase family protein [Actinomadura viridis]|uniref:Alkylation response protein AidB-like acyl-CoA dehydrogenase n=1 Tax=Actinomadura viridis TaxID=58110 RepID=A0A931GN06_9ACTN|nr:acyl-CoA dehydrogenase family protein [Actinomadura viridis]MBG6093828.1 alkylation response protein AidB-like acyl-CoA dehydrogenase [Actinomadura viridis]